MKIRYYDIFYVNLNFPEFSKNIKGSEIWKRPSRTWILMELFTQLSLDQCYSSVVSDGDWTHNANKLVCTMRLLTATLQEMPLVLWLSS